MTTNVVGASIPGMPLRRPRPQRPRRLGLHQHRPRRAGHLHREGEPGQPARVSDPGGLAALRRWRIWRSPSRARARARCRAGAPGTARCCPGSTAICKACSVPTTWPRSSGPPSATTTPRSPRACSIRTMRTVADYMDRMRLFVAPMQSMVVADTDGAIGLIAPGRVPVRDPKNTVAGRAPVPGWDATYDWKGYLKLEDAAARAGCRRRRHRHRQRPHGRSRLSAPPHLRLGGVLPPAAHQGAHLRQATSTTWPACGTPRWTCPRWPSPSCSP